MVLAGCGSSSHNSNPAGSTIQTVTGFVWDNDTAAPIDGATVKVQGTSISVTTKLLSPGVDGAYTITGTLAPTRSYTLQISDPGYVSSVVTMLST